MESRQAVEAAYGHDQRRIGSDGTLKNVVGTGRTATLAGHLSCSAQSRRLDSHQHEPVCKAGVFLSLRSSLTSISETHKPHPATIEERNAAP